MNLTDWLTKQEAAAILGVSFRTLDKFVTDGKLQSAKRQQPGKPPAAVYHPEDVEHLRRERQTEAVHVLPAVRAGLREAAQEPQTFTGIAPRYPPSVAQTVPGEVATDVLFHVLADLRKATISDEKRLFLTIKEASHLSGLTQTYLQRAIEAGTLPVIRDGRRVRIRRKDVEGL